MRSEAHPVRTTALSATATTLVALVAMSAAVASPRPALAGEVRGESHVVRVVAAAVAAAARDLVGAERCTATLALLEPAFGLTDALPSRVVDRSVTVAPTMLLGERLLDLPPPAC